MSLNEIITELRLILSDMYADEYNSDDINDIFYMLTENDTDAFAAQLGNRLDINNEEVTNLKKQIYKCKNLEELSNICTNIEKNKEC